MTDRITADILVEAFDLAKSDFDDLKDRIEEAAAAHKATLSVDGRLYLAVDEQPAARPSVPADADLRDRIVALASDLRYVLDYTGPGHLHMRPGFWDTSGKPCGHCARLTLAREHLEAVELTPEAADRVLDERVAAAKEQQAAPCGPAPDVCDAETGEPCTNHEKEQAHADGEHAFCGPECEDPEHIGDCPGCTNFTLTGHVAAQVEEGGALKRAHVALAEQAGRDQAALARVRALHDSFEASSELTSPDDPITRGAAARRIASALDGVTDQPAN